jgi:hypothetical protein
VVWERYRLGADNGAMASIQSRIPFFLCDDSKYQYIFYEGKRGLFNRCARRNTITMCDTAMLSKAHH